MGFPEQHCAPDEECVGPDAGVFRALRTTVRGQKIEQRTGTVSKESDWAPRIGKVWLYDVTFQPGEILTIVHTYAHNASASVEGPFVNYVTRTGTLWNGPIGRARFTVRTTERPWALQWPRAFVLTSFVERRRAGDFVTEMVFEMANWTPSEDFFLQMGNPILGFDANGLTDCPPPYDLMAPGEDLSEFRAEVAKLSDADLALCARVPHALHGRVFPEDDWNERFYDRQTPLGSSWRSRGFHPNPFYDQSALTKFDRDWLGVYEAVLAARKKPAP